MRVNLTTAIGVLLVVAAIVVLNHMRHASSRDTSFEDALAAVVESEKEQGSNVLEWDLIQRTKGDFESGPVYPKDLYNYEGEEVTICGYLLPLDGDGRLTPSTTVLILPMPYGPMLPREQAPEGKRDIYIREAVLGLMREDQQLRPKGRQAVPLTGTLVLHEGPGRHLFYILAGARKGGKNPPPDPMEMMREMTGGTPPAPPSAAHAHEGEPAAE
jgi:hypothetical protein